MSWPMVALGDVCDLENGDRGKNYPSKSTIVETGVPFVNAGDLNAGGLNNDDLSFISEDHYARLSNGKFEQGDFLFCLRGTLGKFGFVDRPMRGAIASSLIIIRPREPIHASFFNAYLGSSLCLEQINLYKNGAAQPNLAAASLKQFKIPLPPLEEQKRIAGILDQADALRRLRTRALDKLNTLGQAIFHEMFVGKEHQRGRLEALSESIDYGLTASASKKETGPKFLRITDIQDGMVQWDKVPTCDASPKLIASNRLAVGDIVFARTGATTGKSFLIEAAPDDAVFASYLIRVRPNDCVLPPFLFEFFQTADYWSQIQLLSSGAAQPGVNSTKLKELRVPIPPIEQQAAFLDKLVPISAQRKRLTEEVLVFEKLFTSLQHRAFRGEL